MSTQKKISLLLFVILLVWAFLYLIYNNIDGEYIFKREGCGSCHTFKGYGGGAGPDLTISAMTRSNRWLRQQIKNPSKNNPQTRMPAFDHLSRKEINALIKYLKSSK